MEMHELERGSYDSKIFLSSSDLQSRQQRNH